MPLSLSIKNVPDELADRLRERAARAHRSIQGELMAILEEVLVPRKPLTAADVLARVRRMRIQTPDEATTMIRVDRNAG